MSLWNWIRRVKYCNDTVIAMRYTFTISSWFLRRINQNVRVNFQTRTCPPMLILYTIGRLISYFILSYYHVMASKWLDINANNTAAIIWSSIKHILPWIRLEYFSFGNVLFLNFSVVTFIYFIETTIQNLIYTWLNSQKNNLLKIITSYT